MRKSLVPCAVLLLVGLLPAPASAWGFAAHQFIMRRAIDLLPPELAPFFAQQRDEVVVRVKDPDLWRNVGWPEDANHFFDFGVKEYGAYPFTDVPRDYTAALEKFGQATLARNGRLPWRFAEMFGNLRRGFEAYGRGNAYSADDIVLFSAVAAHYIQDAHMPLHAADNYDGQLTGQRGIHARFESELFERYQSRTTFTPPPVTPIQNAEGAAWTVLLESYRRVDELLKADKVATAGLDLYDDRYYDRLYQGVGPLMAQQVAKAISATAATIVGAWIEAGRPAMGALEPRAPQKIDRGR
jgi:hypothetical protein